MKGSKNAILLITESILNNKKNYNEPYYITMKTRVVHLYCCQKNYFLI